MIGITISNLYLFVRGIIIFPNRIFENIKEGKYVKEVYIMFFLGATITFLKTFSIANKVHSFTFFNNDSMNRIMLWFSNPQISWIILYASYFAFIFLVYIVMRFSYKHVIFKTLALSLMSISGIGVIMQILFYGLKYVLPHNILLFSSYLVYFWVIALTILAIRTSHHILLSRAIFYFLISALPFIITVYFVGISPYLAWLII